MSTLVLLLWWHHRFIRQGRTTRPAMISIISPWLHQKQDFISAGTVAFSHRNYEG